MKFSKKLTFCLLVGLLLITIIPATTLLTKAQTLGDRLDGNGGFENEMTGWYPWNAGSDYSTVHSGDYSAVLQCPPSTPYAMQSVLERDFYEGTSPIAVSSVTEFSFWIKMQNIQTGENFGTDLKIYYSDGTSSDVGLGTSQHNWQYVDATSQLTAGKSISAIAWQINGAGVSAGSTPSGKMWIDDVVLSTTENSLLTVTCNYPSIGAKISTNAFSTPTNNYWWSVQPVQPTPYTYISSGASHTWTVQRPVIYANTTYSYVFKNWTLNGELLTTSYTATASEGDLQMNYQGGPTEFTTTWLIGGQYGKLVQFSNDGFLDLTSQYSAINGGLTVSAIQNCYGYYLIGGGGLNNVGYGEPTNTTRIARFDGNAFTNVANFAGTTSIVAMSKFAGNAIIGGEYKSDGNSVPYGRVYSYDGTTASDITTDILGSNLGLDVTAIQEIGEGDYLFGLVNGANNKAYVYEWNGTDLVQLLDLDSLGISAPVTSIAYNGQYALLGSSSDDYLYRYDLNGTLTDISADGGFTDMVIRSMAWNGTDIMVVAGGETAKVALYDGTDWTTISTDYYNVVAWNGYWLLGGDNVLKEYFNSEWTDYTSQFSEFGAFSITAMAPGAINVYVSASPELHVPFTVNRVTYTTPKMVSMPIADALELQFNQQSVSSGGATFHFQTMGVRQSPEVNYTSTSLSLPCIQTDARVTAYYTDQVSVTPTPTPPPSSAPVVPPKHTPSTQEVVAPPSFWDDLAGLGKALLDLLLNPWVWLLLILMLLLVVEEYVRKKRKQSR
ncbi:Uncharacterised protein [uncultured archaeon]|nr:Uncharacterised protein [uncultured archaeon]